MRIFLETVIIVVVLIFTFLLGAKYSDGVKSNLPWLFGESEEQVQEVVTEEAPVEEATNMDGTAQDSNAVTVPTEAVQDATNPATPVVEPAKPAAAPAKK